MGAHLKCAPAVSTHSDSKKASKVSFAWKRWNGVPTLQRTVLLLAMTKPARLYVSRPIPEEYSEVLARPEFRIRKGLR
jgi:hypothetical protein